jgi:hypothetical protein
MRLEVGHTYPLPISAEGGHYSYYGEHDLVLAVKGLTSTEIEDVRHGTAEFALFGCQGILFFLCRFGSAGWRGCPYSWHLDPVKAPAKLSGEQRILLPVTLVELPGHIIRAIRAISLSPEFSRALVDHIREQATSAPISRVAYNAAINAAFGQHMVEDMVNCSFVRCRGGL